MGNNSFYSREELGQLGLKAYGENVLISRKASLYSPETISLGSHVRIDDFCILSGHIEIGNFVHISAYAAIYARERVTIMDYSGLSPRATIFSATDDFTGDYLIGPMAPEGSTNLIKGPVTLEKFVQIGASSVVLPNLTIKEGAVVGSMSLVKSDLKPWGIYTGIPGIFKKERKKRLLRYINLE
jgi:acetyltransferase-like isoleucine patch superfamily enzyme